MTKKGNLQIIKEKKDSLEYIKLRILVYQSSELL